MNQWLKTGGKYAFALGFALNLALSPGLALNTLPAEPPVQNAPFYSQFQDIALAQWQKVGCGIASLAMLIEFYKPGTVSVNTLLKQGIVSGAFVKNAGWSHNGLARLAQKYGLTGASYDFSRLDSNSAFAQFAEILKQGPVIASVHYKLEPKNPIPHLIVINGIRDGLISYNDPAALSSGKEISVQDFIKAWKKRFIAIREIPDTAL